MPSRRSVPPGTAAVILAIGFLVAGIAVLTLHTVVGTNSPAKAVPIFTLTAVVYLMPFGALIFAGVALRRGDRVRGWVGLLLAIAEAVPLLGYAAFLIWFGLSCSGVCNL